MTADWQPAAAGVYVQAAPLHMPAVEDGLRALEPWANEGRADWATALTRMGAGHLELPPDVVAAMDAATDALDELAQLVGWHLGKEVL